MINDIMINSFLTLAKTQNFTKAANILFLSQQAVSKHISKLEQDLDCQLFTRDRGNIHLTDEGEIFLEVFSSYHENLDAAKRRVKSMHTKDAPRIIIGCLDMLDVNTILGPFLTQFKQTHPNVEIEFHSTPDWELPLLFREGKIDIALTFDKEIDPSMSADTIELMESAEVLFVSKHHPLATETATYMDFINEPVFFSLPPSGNVSHLLHRLDILGYPYDNLICTDNMLSSCTSIDMMQGVSFAIDCSRMLIQGNYATYPTSNSVQILLCKEDSNKKKIVNLFMKEAKAFINLQ